MQLIPSLNIQLQKDGNYVADKKALNLIAGGGMTITTSVLGDVINVELESTGGGGGGVTDHGALTGLTDDDHIQYLNNARLALKNENDLEGIPLSTELTYNIDGTLATSIKGGITKTFTYVDGQLAEVTNGDWTKTFNYNLDGSLSEIIVT